MAARKLSISLNAIYDFGGERHFPRQNTRKMNRGLKSVFCEYVLKIRFLELTLFVCEKLRQNTRKNEHPFLQKITDGLI